MQYLQLAYFYRAAQYQHMTRAAQSLHISQPALTKMIKQLEQECMLPLFYKKGRNIVLTEFGQYLKKRLDEIIPAMDRLPEEIEAYRADALTKIKLNVLAASTIVTDAVIRFKQQNTEISFQLFQNEEDTDCDIVVTTNASDNVKLPAFRHHCMMEEKIYLAVPRSSPYASRSEILLREVQDECFVQLAGSRRFRNVCDTYCMRVGVKPHTVFESDSPTAVKNIIGANAGIGFWPEYSWGKPASEEITLVPITNPICQRELIIGVCENRRNTRLITDFYHYLVAFIRERQHN